MNKYKILIVDDEPDLCDILEVNLVTQGYDVTIAYSAEQALLQDINSFNLILLDVMMGEMSGFDMLKLIRQDSSIYNIPVLFLTAKDDEEDVLAGFGLGADDYIPKPFSMKEVIARVKAVLSRSTQIDKREKHTVRFKNLSVNNISKSVMIDNNSLTLTRTEFDLLWLLINNPDYVFSRHELIRAIWPNDVIVTDRTVDVNITRLRRKLNNFADAICTRQGFGYFFKSK